MATSILTAQQLESFVDNLIGAGNVVGVQRKDNKFAFAPLGKAKDIVWDYDVTLLPPKKYIMPQWETLIEFKIKDKVEVEEVVEKAPLTIVGVHPYDLRAINQLDRLFEEKHPESNYLKRRAAVTIIALTPARASKWSFWNSMDCAYVTSGFDLMLTDLGGRFAVEIGTSKGEEILKKHAKSGEASKDDLKKLEEVKLSLVKMCSAERKINANTAHMHKLLQGREKAPIWEDKAKTCYSCGSCNLICPTCWCFDVREELNLDLDKGRRYRVWDGCLLEDFAKIGSGENFRKERLERFRHRFYRKWTYLYTKLSEPACVGCGRCSSVCLPDIADPVKVFNTLKEEK
jgi:sulfhydrogenase subunit beta (sulfur reductase)